MVDIKTETKPQQNEKPANPRDAIRAQRERRLRLINSGKTNTIKVFAANEELRQVLRHPGRNIGFRGALDQPVEWPNDSFTHRRLKEGWVRTLGPGPAERVADDEALNPRQQSAARYGQQQATEAKQEASSGEGEKPENGSKPARPSQQPVKPEPQPQAG